MYDDELVLLNPGPAGTSKQVREALLRGDLCHREREFTDLLTAVRRALPLAANVSDTHEAVLITGSGTAAMEMAIIGAVRSGRSVLVVDNGVYGDRLGTMANAHGITAHRVRPPGDELTRWTTPVGPQEIRRALTEHDDIDVVACVHHETTTGLINPIREIGTLCREFGVLFLVDAISSLGNEEQDLAAVDADLICGSANKGLHGLPGLAFLLIGERGEQRIREAPQRSVYLSPVSYLDGQRKENVPFTPAVQILYALDQALVEYQAAGGFEARTALYRERAALVRAGFAELGLMPLVDEPHRSNSVTALPLPPGVRYDPLHDALKQRGYVIYGGQGNLNGRCFRICTMGEIPRERLVALTGALEAAIADCRGT